MTTRHLLLTTWHWHPSVLLGCAALALGYAALLRFRWTPRATLFGLGLGLLLLALLSPLHTLGDRYLFSAHMLQHLLLLLVVPPLLLLGLTDAALERLLGLPGAGRIERVLGRPLLAWTIGMSAMWLWHLPALYNAALESELLHIVEHLSFLGSALIFWWPICVPDEHGRLHPLAGIGYLFAAMIVSGVLGMILTFASPGWYPRYLNPPDPLGVLPLLWGQWGLTPAVDQQVGGLLMWVPGGLVYLAAIVALTARWYGTPEEEPPELRAGSLRHEQREMIDVR
jgi:putative membrane protein